MRVELPPRLFRRNSFAMLAFSTCWNAHRHTDGEHLINEVLLLGFDAVEFSYGFGKELFPGFRKGFDQRRIKVSGAKYPCPARPADSELGHASLTAGDAATRKVALQQIMMAIDRVDEFDGRYLILPLGEIDTGISSDALVQRLCKGERHQRDYVTEKLALIEQREGKTDDAMALVVDAFKQLVPYAKARGVRLAIENRARYEQFPSVREIETLLDQFDSPWLGYWHDFGHAERQAQLGFLDHSEQIERLAPRLVGCHIHDLVWPEADHAVPGQGVIPFEQLIPGLPKETNVVWEIQTRRKTADIKAALIDWKQKFP